MQTRFKLPKAITENLQDFLDQSGYLITDEVGDTVIQERIKRLYNRLANPNTPKDQLPSTYKLLMGYSLLGLQRETLEKDSRAERKHKP